jgi:hypothetical protein
LSRRTHPIGDIHKNLILGIVNRNPVTGITQPEIIDNIAKLSISHENLSRQTVSKLLGRLMKEAKLSKRGRRYFPLNDDAVNMNIFAASINVKLREMLLSDDLINIISNKFCSGLLLTHDPNAKYIFEFANLLGASMIYLLVEGMRPGEVSSKYKEDINIFDHLIRNSLPLDEIVLKLRQKMHIRTERTAYGVASLNLDCDDFRKLSREFRKVYPDLYMELEEGWQSMSQLMLTPRNDKRQMSCNHKWHGRYLYRYGEYYECRNCFLRKTAKSK